MSLFFGLNSVRIDSMLAELAKSEFNFHLTGSRFFKMEHSESDYDFFVEDFKDPSENLAVAGFLSDLGFQYVECSSYCQDDAEIVAVWQHHRYPIDIQVVKDATLKCIAQEFLLKHKILKRRMSRTERMLAWKIAYKHAEELINTSREINNM